MRFINYVKNAYAELVQKVSWPSWSQLCELGGHCYDSFPVIRRGRAQVIDQAFENLMKAIYSILY